MNVKQLSLLSFLALLSAGCSTFDTITNNKEYCFDDTGQTIECIDQQDKLRLNPTSAQSDYQVNRVQDPSLFSTNLDFQLLKDYVENMAMNLKHQSQMPLTAPIAVTSFVQLDSTLKNTNILGNQISEYFVSELKGVGFPVSDYKVTGFIQVTPEGDLAMSRQFEELNQSLKVGYVLTGTLIRNERGMVVSARIVSLSTNQVVSSTTKLLPSLIVDRIL